MKLWEVNCLFQVSGNSRFLRCCKSHRAVFSLAVWDSTSLAERRNNPSWVAQMAKVIDTMGRLSAQAQGLPSPITTRAKARGLPFLHCSLFRTDLSTGCGLGGRNGSFPTKSQLAPESFVN